MYVTTLLSAGLALTANAFLLPPEAANNLEAAKNNVAPHLIDPQSRSIDLDCSDCPYALASQRNGHHEWTHDVKSDLRLKFTTEGNQLKLNGVPFYPVTQPFTPAPLSAKQIQKTVGDEVVSKQGHDGDLALSYTVEFNKEKKSFPAPGQDAVVTEITFSVLGLDNEVVHVDDVKIKTLSLPSSETAKHELIIVSVDTESPEDNTADARCGTIMCRVVQKFRSAVHKAQTHAKTAAHKMKCFCMKCLHAFRPSHHHAPHHPATPNVNMETTHLPTHHRMRPGHFRPHHTGHRHHSGWMHAFVRASRHFFSFVLLPILVGIVFGITASAIGMLVGQIIVAVWLRLRRSSRTTAAYERVASEEKDGLPKYEDLEDSTKVTDEKV
ncbi:MAG: hypothetical protein Q9220_000287 [cf. Caloplaca sp. 1 TL-2023]